MRFLFVGMALVAWEAAARSGLWNKILFPSLVNIGQELVLYRGASGRVVMLDAHCPHMGTHLGRNSTSYVCRDGAIEGDSIRCPYHAWRFGPGSRRSI